ncbi:response regulator transcription factor [Paenibacillus aestuarii]|uniref:Response regulator n=1 Tax=Paenibacillus aestuarii TaxID=516965 RepID=A0ABW0K5S2_9BACL|nr:response regulator [Paenibacillus aestuarii]
MFKVLIIDDEDPARRAIRALGAWDQWGFTTIIEAWNGQMGLDLLAEHRPELVFVDMRMPLLSGVEFLEKARELVPEAKYIVISGYNDFQYTHSAIQAGALDYLLKPIKKQELNTALQKVADKLAHEREHFNRMREEMIFQNISSPLLKEKIFTSIIEQNGRFHQMKELASLIEPAAGGNFYYAIVMMVLNMSDICGTKFAGDLPACYFALSNAINELLEPLGKAFSFKSGRDDQEMVIVLTANQPLAVQTARNELQLVIRRLRETFGVEAMAAMGSEPITLSGLDAAYQSAKTLMLQADLLRHEDVQVKASPSDTHAERPSVWKHKDLLIHALETGSAIYAENVIYEMFSALKSSGSFTIDDLLKTESELRLIGEQIVSHPGRFFDFGEHGDKFDRLFAYPVMSFDVFVKLTTTWLMELFQAEWAHRKPKDKVNIEQIKSYIDTNYYEDLSIAFFTEKYYLSKEHLTRLFKQKYGYGLYEYILKVRMERAKELLADSQLKIQLVCEKVGYNDSNYFSKAFKKYVGVSPQDYRSRV